MNGRMYVFGGRTLEMQVLNDLFEFTVGTHSLSLCCVFVSLSHCVVVLGGNDTEWLSGKPVVQQTRFWTCSVCTFAENKDANNNCEVWCAVCSVSIFILLLRSFVAATVWIEFRSLVRSGCLVLNVRG